MKLRRAEKQESVFATFPANVLVEIHITAELVVTHLNLYAVVYHLSKGS